MSDADEKAISAAFMMISPLFSKNVIENIGKKLGNDDSGLLYLIGEYDAESIVSNHQVVKSLAIWTIGALGYDATIWGLDSTAFAAAKEAIKLSIPKLSAAK